MRVPRQRPTSTRCVGRSLGCHFAETLMWGMGKLVEGSWVGSEATAILPGAGCPSLWASCLCSGLLATVKVRVTEQSLAIPLFSTFFN